MVSELLQDSPRLVKQMGSIIFILVYKWIFKFPLGYLKYHQRSTHNTHPAQTKFHESFCPRKILSLWLSAAAARNCGQTFGVLQGWPEAAHPWKPCWDGPRLHSSGSSCGSPAAAEDSCGVCCAVAAPQSSVQCWKSRGSSDVWATGLLRVHPLISLPLADFDPVITSQSSWTPQLNSCWADRSSSIPAGERDVGHFRKDMLLETCPCCGNAWERPDTQSRFSDFSPFCTLHYFFCGSLTYRHIGQIHFPLLWIWAEHLGLQEGRPD